MDPYFGKRPGPPSGRGVKHNVSACDSGPVDAREQLKRRQEVLALPMRPLREHLQLRPPSDGGSRVGSFPDPYWERRPHIIGVGAEGELVTVWGHRAHSGLALSRHDPDGRSVVPST